MIRFKGSEWIRVEENFRVHGKRKKHLAVEQKYSRERIEERNTSKKQRIVEENTKERSNVNNNNMFR